MSDEDRSCCRRSHASSSAIAMDRWSSSSSGAARRLSRSRRDARAPQRRRLSGSQRRNGRSDLIFCNGLGGFTADGREYVITVRARDNDAGTMGECSGQSVVRNADLGERQRQYLERERAGVPSHPVVQRSGRRSEHRGAITSVTKTAAASGRPRCCPRGGAAPYVTRHGFGYSIFEHSEDGIDSELVGLCGHRRTGQVRGAASCTMAQAVPRRLSVTGYLEWVLGDVRAKIVMHVITELDPRAARCSRATRTAPISPEASRSSTSDDATRSVQRRSRRIPRTQWHAAQSGRDVSGRGFPASSVPAWIRALQSRVPLELADGQTREIVFRLGAGRNALRKPATWYGAGEDRLPRDDALAAMQQYWRQHARRGAGGNAGPGRSTC